MLPDPSLFTTIDMVQTILKMLNIPIDIAQDCELLIFQKDTRRCFETVVLYLQQHFKGENDDFLYFPFGELEKVFQITVSKTLCKKYSHLGPSLSNKNNLNFSCLVM